MSFKNLDLTNPSDYIFNSRDITSNQSQSNVIRVEIDRSEIDGDAFLRKVGVFLTGNIYLQNSQVIYTDGSAQLKAFSESLRTDLIQSIDDLEHITSDIRNTYIDSTLVISQGLDICDNTINTSKIIGLDPLISSIDTDN